MDMQIFRVGSRPSAKGPDEYFTGSVRLDMLFGPDEPARTSGAMVTFEPGARTAWHRHPLGQYLIVTSVCVGRSVGRVPKKKFVPATSCAATVAASTGTVPRTRPA